MQYCLSCFHKDEIDFAICPKCGQPKISEAKSPVHLPPGTVLRGRYLIGLSVGEGGFGVVYRAYDLKLQIIVAIKEFYMGKLVTRAPGRLELILNQKHQKEFEYRKERFLAEARAMAMFRDYPSITRVYEHFEENGTAYIVMELLQGQTLSAQIKQKGVLDQEFALYTIGEVGDAITAMHKKGIIHRDIAPDNIFVETSKGVRIKTYDLGAAKLQDKTDEVIDLITKPGYSPPEQYEKQGKIGTWSDVYALGATLYVMLTGEKPEESTNRKIEDKVLSPREINPAISEDLSNAIMRAMAVEPHLRYQTVQEFLEAIRGERKVVSVEDEKKRRRSRRMIGIAAGVAVVALALLATWLFYQKRRASEGLLPTEFEIWYSPQEGSGEKGAMESIAKDFMASYEGVVVTLKAIPEDEYEDAIRKAAAEGRLPNLFESSGLEKGLLSAAADVKSVLQSEQARACYFLDQYERYYPEAKQIPMGIEVPMVWIVTNGKVQSDFKEDSFKNVTKLAPADLPLAVDERCEGLVSKNFSVANAVGRSAFLSRDESKEDEYEGMTAPVLLTSTLYIDEVRSIMRGVEKHFAYYDSSSVFCGFVYEWSVGNGNDRQKNAATRFLAWMLGEAFQNSLMITENSQGQIPLCKTSFEEKCRRSQYLTPLLDMTGKLKFERQ